LIEVKECRLCKNEHPLTHFYKKKSAKDGLQSYCKDCTRASNYSDGKWLTDIRRRARKEGLKFDLTREDFVIPEKCPALGIPIVRGHENMEHWPSIDRIIPERGYVKGNVRVISARANTIKRDATLSELEKIVEYVRANS
jgi:hypothetical protein